MRVVPQQRCHLGSGADIAGRSHRFSQAPTRRSRNDPPSCPCRTNPSTVTDTQSMAPISCDGFDRTTRSGPAHRRAAARSETCEPAG